MTPRRAALALTVPHALVWTLSTAAIAWAGNTLIENYKSTGESAAQQAARDRELDDVKTRIAALEAKGCQK